MKRLGWIGPWRRIGVQLGLLAGVGLAFVGGIEPPRLAAAPANCKGEALCTLQKPLFMIVLDYSTSMNAVFDEMDPDPSTNTRWSGAKKAIKAAIDSDNGWLASNVILGLTRFGHDPNPGVAGTTIPNDDSGLVDGQKLDVPWYDEVAPGKDYVHCTNGDAINDALAAMSAPIDGNLLGIGTWTKGALDFTSAYITKTRADHPGDQGTRLAALMVITDGEWTNTQGNANLSPAGENPAITAGALYNQPSPVPTYVVALGEAQGKAFADELAAAGGTMKAIDVVDNAALVKALKAVIVDLQKDVLAPVCAPGMPRIMVLLDASSSMLNVANKHAGFGQGGWEEARQALAGDVGSIFDVLVDNTKPAEDVVHLGLAVFGYNLPGEEKLVVQYGPCHRKHFAWALDPATSCGAGCNDPYGAPPITWTFLDGQANNPPGFDEQTLSHMPKCDLSANLPAACVGSGTFVHLGLNLIQANVAAYKAGCEVDGAPYPCSDATKYLNIIIIDGDYNSTDAQVQAPLEAMFNAGITTLVIGFGDLVHVPASLVKLDNMAKWGSGGAEKASLADSQAELEVALKGIIEGLSFDPCCKFEDCTFIDYPGDETTESPPDETTADATTTLPGDTTAGTTVEPGVTETGTTTGSGPTTEAATTTGPGPTTEAGTTTGPDATTATGVTGTPTGGIESTGLVTSSGTTTAAGSDSSDGDDSSCACNGATNQPGWLLALLPLLGRRRTSMRRRSPELRTLR